MGAKKPGLSPALQRAADIQAATPKPVGAAQPEWAEWETKLDRISGRSTPDILHGWMAHIPQISPAGAPPRSNIGSISTIDDVLPKVPKKGDLVQNLTGARSAVLHEAFYLLHKAIHVQSSCAKGISEGRPTWAVVDAYQASLFALASIMGFLGITVERSCGHFILIDVWESGAGTGSVSGLKPNVTKNVIERYKFIRFKTLDHFHKWAILKRLLRTLKSTSALGQFILSSISGLDDKSFANHRNTVHYQSDGWIADDLLQADNGQPIKPPTTPQELHDEIFNGTESGTICLMCALIEFACEFADKLFTQGVLIQEKPLLERRIPARAALTSFDWNTI